MGRPYRSVSAGDRTGHRWAGPSHCTLCCSSPKEQYFLPFYGLSFHKFAISKDYSRGVYSISRGKGGRKENGGHIEPRYVRGRSGERKSTVSREFSLPFSRTGAGVIHLAGNTGYVALDKEISYQYTGGNTWLGSGIGTMVVRHELNALIAQSSPSAGGAASGLYSRCSCWDS